MKISNTTRQFKIIELTTQEMFDNITTDPNILLDEVLRERVTFALVAGRESEIRRLVEEDGLLNELIGPIAVAQIANFRYLDLVVTNHRDETITLTLVQEQNGSYSKS